MSIYDVEKGSVASFFLVFTIISASMFDGVNVIQTHFVFALKVKKFGENESAYMKLVLRGAASDGI